MSTQARPLLTDGEIVSFKMEKEVAAKARKAAFGRMIPFSMWLREAAREKLRKESKGSGK